MLIIAHRGASGLYPENTLLSFNSALELKAPAVEFDVMLTSDGVPMVFHDDDTKRLTGRSGRFNSMTYEQIASLDVSGERIPTLKETLSEIMGRALINLELKDPAATQAVIEELQSLDETSMQSILVSSFEHQTLYEVREALPDLALGVLSEHLDDAVLETGKALSALSINLPITAVNEKALKVIHSANLSCLVYTVNTQRQAQLCRDAGVDGIFTDYPERFLRGARGSNWNSAL